jgi:transposase InsO family protein
MDERRKLISDWQRRVYTIMELSARYGVSRQSVYKWIERYKAEGWAGLHERSRAPQHRPQATALAVVQAVIAARRLHPTWGPRKLLPWLAKRQPHLELPALSTAGDLLRRQGLVAPRRRRRRGMRSRPTLSQGRRANDVWSIDFKGQFRTGDGAYCYPLTVLDDASRYLLGCQALLDTSLARCRRALARIFAESGVPQVIRSDNGTPFAAGNSQLGLSELGVWWIELGIRHERIQPGRPDQNGRHERFHRTLKHDTTRPPAANVRGQQRRFTRFQAEYNGERPHEALGDVPPATCWRASRRPYRDGPRQPEYPGHYWVRRIDANGAFKFRTRRVFLSTPLAGKLVGLEEVADGLWAIHFHHVELTRFDERSAPLHV